MENLKDRSTAELLAEWERLDQLDMDMKTETPPETINEAVNALLATMQSPSIGDQTTITIQMHGTDEDRDDLDRRIKAAIKRDKYSFLDGVVGRGKGRAKSQGCAQHFKR